MGGDCIICLSLRFKRGNNGCFTDVKSLAELRHQDEGGAALRHAPDDCNSPAHSAAIMPALALFKSCTLTPFSIQNLHLNPLSIFKLSAALRRACIDTVRTDLQAQRDQSLLQKMNPLS